MFKVITLKQPYCNFIKVDKTLIICNILFTLYIKKNK